METFGRKMSYALQVDAPLSQGFTTPDTITRSTFSSPTLGPSSRRASRNDESESSSRWTPPGRISRPSGVSPSHARSPSQPSPERMHSPRMSSTSNYMTKRQQEAYDLRSEVDEENRKRRERRTVVVKDGYKIVDGVRAKASSSGVYTREFQRCGGCVRCSRFVSQRSRSERRRVARNLPIRQACIHPPRFLLQAHPGSQRPTASADPPTCRMPRTSAQAIAGHHSPRRACFPPHFRVSHRHIHRTRRHRHPPAGLSAPGRSSLRR